MHRAFLTATALLMGTTALAAPDALSREEARHLIARTGLGVTAEEIDRLAGRPVEDAVSGLIAGIRTEPSTPMPAWASAWMYPYDPIWTLSQTEQELFYANRYMEIDELAGWWMAEMVATPSPLTERLTLFWHDHFATSFEAEENSQWMARQNAFFRANAAGNFADLAHGILRDPAMLSYLSNTENFADAPNENLGREFLELFTLGEGRGYTEADVKEAARALTGHSIDDQGAYAFFAEDHDDGRKTILGRTGAMDASGLADTVLKDPAFGPYVVEKLWKAFVSPTSDKAEVARLTDLWKENDLELAPLLEALFLTDAFWDPANRGALIKSPVELIAGTLRSTGSAGLPMSEAAWIAADMGQHLFHPPNVSGWQGGPAWINTSTALLRSQALTDFADGGYEDEDAAPMMAASIAAVPAIGDGDLRVGRAFGRWGEETEDGGIIAMITLYDVSFGGATWRSLSLVVETIPGEGLAVYIPTTDCGPICTPETKRHAAEADGWFGLYFFEDEMEIEAPVSAAATPILRNVLGHLPELFATTEASTAWQAFEDEETPPPFPSLAKVVGDVASLSRDAMGAPEGTLVFGLSRAGSDGLGGIDQVMTPEMIDAYAEESEAARVRYSAPQVAYSNAADWLAAFPSREDAAATLLPIEATLPEGDAEDFLKALLLSPAYQLK